MPELNLIHVRKRGPCFKIQASACWSFKLQLHYLLATGQWMVISVPVLLRVDNLHSLRNKSLACKLGHGELEWKGDMAMNKTTHSVFGYWLDYNCALSALYALQSYSLFNYMHCTHLKTKKLPHTVWGCDHLFYFFFGIASRIYVHGFLLV